MSGRRSTVQGRGCSVTLRLLFFYRRFYFVPTGLDHIFLCVSLPICCPYRDIGLRFQIINAVVVESVIDIFNGRRRCMVCLFRSVRDRFVLLLRLSIVVYRDIT